MTVPSGPPLAPSSTRYTHKPSRSPQVGRPLEWPGDSFWNRLRQWHRRQSSLSSNTPACSSWRRPGLGCWVPDTPSWRARQCLVKAVHMYTPLHVCSALHGKPRMSSLKIVSIACFVRTKSFVDIMRHLNYDSPRDDKLLCLLISEHLPIENGLNSYMFTVISDLLINCWNNKCQYSEFVCLVI